MKWGRREVKCCENRLKTHSVRIRTVDGVWECTNVNSINGVIRLRKKQLCRDRWNIGIVEWSACYGEENSESLASTTLWS